MFFSREPAAAIHYFCQRVVKAGGKNGLGNSIIFSFDQLHQHLRDRGATRPRLYPFLCMVDRRKSLHKRICASPTEHHPEMLGTAIPYSSLVEQMGLRRAPLPVFAPSAEPTRAYEALWGEITSRLAV